MLAAALAGRTTRGLSGVAEQDAHRLSHASDRCHPLLRTYYVSANGNDGADGLSPDTAWATLEKVSRQFLHGEVLPGDTIRLEGGHTFAGSLIITQSGLPNFPVTIGSFGTGRAVIRRQGDAIGVMATNVSHVVLEDLELDGLDRMTNTRCGLYIATETPQRDLTLRNLLVRRWGEKAIVIQSDFPANGLVGVLLEDVVVAENRGVVGLYIGSAGGRSYSFVRDVTVRRTRVSDTIGPAARVGGAGLVLEYCDGFLIEDVELAYNGAGVSASGGGGPTAMWTAYARNGVIRRVEAHHTITSSAQDGSGIDLDAGTQNVIVEHCYTHHNAGAGLMAYHWDAQGATFGAWRNNVFRYNVSVDDGQSTPTQGAVSVAHHAAHAGRLDGLDAYGNTVVAATGTRPLVALGTSMSNVRFRNNIFVSRSASRAMVETRHGAPGVSFLGNDWYAAGGVWRVDWNGTLYESLAEWRSLGSACEGGREAPVGVDADPLLADPADQRTVGLGGDLASIAGYRLRDGSSMPTAGLDLRALYSLPDQDFYRAEIPGTGEMRAIGAATRSGS
jgi:hypothetical protein